MCVKECVCVDASLSVVGALERVMRRCVGPHGGSVLFTRDSGGTFITRQGQQILTALNLDHPMARMVLECVCTHYLLTADGSKTFIILLSTLLQRIRDVTHTHRKTCLDSMAAARQLAHQLVEFSRVELDDVLVRSVFPHASSLFRSQGGAVERGALQRLISGYVAGRLGSGQAELLTGLLCDLYLKTTCGASTVQPIQFLHSQFSLLHTLVPGLSIGQSLVLEGLVLSRDWSVWKEKEEPVRALMLCESMGMVASGVSVCAHQDWAQRAEFMLEQVWERLMSLQVHVLLSTVRQPQCVLQWAELNDTAVVECVDPTELDLIWQISGAHAVTHQALGRIVTVTFCKRLQVGGCRYAHVGLHPAAPVHAHTLLLCAPTPGLLQQCVCVCEGALTMLQRVCQPLLRQTLPPHQTRNSDVCQTPVLNHSQNTSPVLDHSQNSSPVLDHSQNSSPVLKHSQNTPPVPAQSDSGGPVVCAVLPVGGMFELLLHDALSHASYHGYTESCRLLAEALLSVPRTLGLHKPHLQTLPRSLCNQRQQSAVGSGGSEFRSSLVCVESVSCKQQLVVSVLECAVRMLCVSAVLHTAVTYSP
ncbi:BBSome complex assembly protein BBS10 [Chanos chanos]|uniref:BBSome complex assembly protein BBS10 n=1 Tax=Chanos chanos TaxID=29144 RepID=A0A6J2WRC8_CHACN|nr:Bardet-Biedl syndrome 10 protein [Chanos chanos]